MRIPTSSDDSSDSAATKSEAAPDRPVSDELNIFDVLERLQPTDGLSADGSRHAGQSVQLGVDALLPRPGH